MSAVIADAAASSDAIPFRRGKKKLIILVAAVLAVVLAAGGGTVVYLKKKAAAAAQAEANDADSESGETETTAAAASKGPPTYLPLEPFVVNLADRESDRYAQIGITLEVESGMFADRMKAYMPSIRNAILMVIAHKSAKDLLGRTGKEELAAEIMREAIRPMGIEIAAPEPVTPAPLPVPAPAAIEASGAASTPQDEAPKPKKPKPRIGLQKNPIQHVHFSSFIIQ